MGTKRTPNLVTDAKRLRKAGYSFAEVAEKLSKEGRPISKATVINWLRDPEVTTAGPELPEPVTAAPSVTPPTPPPTPSDADEGDDIGPEELRALLAGELRRHQAEAEKAMADGRPGDARQSSRLVAAFTSQLQRIHARQDEDTETVRVRAGDIDAAAERALTGLRQLADRVTAERSTWPKCAGCGQHRGEFAGGDKSALRAMFERVATGG